MTTTTKAKAAMVRAEPKTTSLHSELGHFRSTAITVPQYDKLRVIFEVQIFQKIKPFSDQRSQNWNGNMFLNARICFTD